MKIKIRGRDYKLTTMTSTEYWGITSTTRRTIQIMPDETSVENTIQTIVHELIHGFLYECGVEYENKEEENIATWFEIQFLFIFECLCRVLARLYPEEELNLNTIIKYFNDLKKRSKPWKSI